MWQWRTSIFTDTLSARLAQSVEHETLNLGVVGSSPTLGEIFSFHMIFTICLDTFLDKHLLRCAGFHMHVNIILGLV